MTRILVTGSQGLLGSTLVPHLRSCEYETLLHARKGECDVRADLTDDNQVIAAMNEIMPEVIVNLAALTNVDECERNPQHAYLANVKTVANLARWIQTKDNACYLVQLSTDQVYDGFGPHKENDITLRNYYGFSKYAAELVAATVPSSILRTNFFGPSRCQSRTSLSDWLVQSLTAGRMITVFDDVRFSPLSMQHLVELVDVVIRQRRRGVFNLGSIDGLSKADFAFALAEVLDLPTRNMSRGVSGRAKLAAVRPTDMRMDSTRFEESFGVRLPALWDEIYSMKAAYAHATR